MVGHGEEKQAGIIFPLPKPSKSNGFQDKEIRMKKKILLGLLKKVIREEYPQCKIILYGSRCREDSNVFSDWDILILINDDLNENGKIELQNKIYEIELESNEIINSIIHTNREWSSPLMQSTPFYENVQKEGISI